MGVVSYLATRDRVRIVGYTGLIGNSLMTLLLSWGATPFFVAPALGVITAMSLATHPRLARGWVLVVVLAASVLAPFFLELAGVLPQSTFIAGRYGHAARGGDRARPVDDHGHARCST